MPLASRSARVGALLQVGESRLPRMGEVARLRRLDGADHIAVLRGNAAALSARGARPRQNATIRTGSRARRTLLRSVAVLVRVTGRRRSPTCVTEKHFGLAPTHSFSPCAKASLA